MRKKKKWYKFYCFFIRIFKKPIKIKYLGDEPTKSSLILSNHVGSSGPLTFELYHKQTYRLWGTHEMNGNIKDVYKYLSTTYFHQKKHVNAVISKIIAFFLAPLLRLFYRGLDLLPTYQDARLYPTIKNSFSTLKENQSVVIFPEKSENGYFDKLTGFHSGFVVLCEYCLKKGMDLPIYTAYLDKKSHVQLFDKPILYSEIKQRFETKEEIAEYFCNKCNKLSNIIKESKN